MKHNHRYIKLPDRKAFKRARWRRVTARNFRSFFRFLCGQAGAKPKPEFEKTICNARKRKRRENNVQSAEDHA